MLKNYLKTILRSLLRERSNTIINIIGLTLGITGSLVLFLVIKESHSFDKYHTHRDRIYRVISKSNSNGGINLTQAIPAVMPEVFKNEFPEVKEIAFTSYRRGALISIQQPNSEVKKYEEPKGTVFTEPSFFKIFDRKIIAGSAENGLNEPNEAIISRKWATKYFGRIDVLDEIISYEHTDYKITAVMEDYPSNTDLPFDLILSYATIKKSYDTRGWHDLNDNDNCYFLLEENKSIGQVEAKLPTFVKKYYGEGDQNPFSKTLAIQPLGNIHSDMRVGNYNTKMPTAANYVFGAIALILIVTACVNFINLTTAAAIKRTREVGIRKVLGSTRGQLIFQFVSEAFLVTCVAGLISLACAQIFLEYTNSILESDLRLNLGSDKIFWMFFGILTVGVTLLSGLYPAFMVSAFKPALALKNQLSHKTNSGYTLRRGLVVLQFFISQFFIIGTVILTKQLNFLQKQDVGFHKDAIVVLPIPVAVDSLDPSGIKIRSLKNEMLRLPGVEKASLNFSPPSARTVKGTTFSIDGEEMNTQVKEVDGDYIDLFGVHVLAGEKLPDADSVSRVVVNEKFVQQAGFKSNEEIIGKEINLWGMNIPVTGVVKDFNTTSLERAIEPVLLVNNVREYHSLSIKLNTSDMQGTIEKIKDNWEAAYPEYIFKYEFMDEQIRSLYKGERKIATLLNIFSAIAIIIGCLGLFGLVTFMANQKTKEIGVRKVLGASVESIVYLFSKEFVKLITIGFVLAAPIAGFAMHKVLQEFAYKITIGPSIFLTGIGITFLIAFATVGYRSIRAALANPTDSLRSE
jgi:ABC-type antimicrobial peptide transport system permease subunit